MKKSSKMISHFLIMFGLVVLFTSFGYGSSDSLVLQSKKRSLADSNVIVSYLDSVNELQDNDPSKASSILDKLLIITEKSDRPFYLASKARAFNQKGIIQMMQGHFPEALNALQTALTVYDKLYLADKNHSDYYEGKASVLGNIGTIYYHMSDFNKAIEYWKQAVKDIVKLGNKGAEAMLLNNIGVVYLKMNEPEKALGYYNQALDIFIANNSEKEIAMCYTNIGEIYGQMGFFAKSLELLEKSRLIKEKLNDKHGLLQCLLSMATLSQKMNEDRKTIELAMQAQSLSQHLSAKKEMLTVYELLSYSYSRLMDYKKAYNYHFLLKQLNDSIFNHDIQTRFDEIQAKYTSEINEKELANLRQREKYHAQVRKILIAGFALVMVVSVLLIGSVTSKKKKEKTLFQKNQLLMEQEKKLIQTELEKKELINSELNQEIEFKTRQLTTHALNIMQKNKMLYEMLKSIDALVKKTNDQAKEDLKQLKTLVKRNLKTDKDWEVFRLYFEQVNKNFFSKLLSINPELNVHDLRHCALISLNLNIKETASVLNLSPNSIKSARYRLKKKLDLKPEDDLFEFLRNI